MTHDDEPHPGQPVNRAVLPTWLATATILAIHMGIVAFLPDPPVVREMAFVGYVRLLCVIAVGTATAAFLYPRVRAGIWLIGTLLTMVTTMSATWEVPAPPSHETFACYSLAAVMLAIGTWSLRPT